jgi:hypothetical protein
MTNKLVRNGIKTPFTSGLGAKAQGYPWFELVLMITIKFGIIESMAYPD